MRSGNSLRNIYSTENLKSIVCTITIVFTLLYLQYTIIVLGVRLLIALKDERKAKGAARKYPRGGGGGQALKNESFEKSE